MCSRRAIPLLNAVDVFENYKHLNLSPMQEEAIFN